MGCARRTLTMVFKFIVLASVATASVHADDAPVYGYTPAPAYGPVEPVITPPLSITPALSLSIMLLLPITLLPLSTMVGQFTMQLFTMPQCITPLLPTMSQNLITMNPQSAPLITPKLGVLKMKSIPHTR